MSILKTENEPNRLHRMRRATRGTAATVAGGTRELAATTGHQLRHRASGLGTSTRDTARAAGDRARATAADRLVTAARTVEPRRASGRSRMLRLVLVALAAGAVLWLVRALMTRSAAGEESTADQSDDRESPSSDGRRETGAPAAEQRSADPSRAAS